MQHALDAPPEAPRAVPRYLLETLHGTAPSCYVQRQDCRRSQEPAATAEHLVVHCGKRLAQAALEQQKVGFLGSVCAASLAQLQLLHPAAVF